ncbi:MAG TPA: xanthine dehydrogenase family protein subunit M [Anaerolineae bacterium]|nr:xanthine dehydrogenase family protein subunit M [Anaerolineae bacterium]
MFARPGLPSFEYVRASSAGEVVGLLQEHGLAARPLMGGTDLLPGLREGRLCPRLLVDVKSLPGMRELHYDHQAGLAVGAAVTMNELARDPNVRAHYPLLAQAAAAVASYQVRNRATFGGNLCNASPCADTAPAALVLEAELALYGPGGERLVPAGEFFLGPGRTCLQPEELMTAVRLPAPPPGNAARYLKLGRCRSGDLALVGVAVLGFASDAPSGYTFRIGLGSVAPTPIRAWQAEALLAENLPGEEAFSKAAELAVSAASPITDVRGTAEYQRAMVRNLTLRGLHEVWERLSGA